MFNVLALCMLQMPAPDAAALVAATSIITDTSAVYWFPEYGCAVLALQGDSSKGAGGLEGPGIQLGVGTAELHTVCLDGWEHRLHRWGRWTAEVVIVCCQVCSLHPSMSINRKLQR